MTRVESNGFVAFMSYTWKSNFTRTAFSHGPAMSYTGEAYIYITRVESNECVAFMSHIWKSHVTCTVFSNEPAINYKGESMHSYDLSDCVALLQFFSMGDTHFFLHFT